MDMNRKNIMIGIFAAVFLAVALFSLRGFMSTYVPFNEAMTSETSVQIMGTLMKDGIEITVRHLAFTLIDDDGTRMRVKYRGPKPQNFEHARQVVAIGMYDPAKKVFAARKILTKCPSKYQRKDEQ